jgi:hypothetical protein
MRFIIIFSTLLLSHPIFYYVHYPKQRKFLFYFTSDHYTVKLFKILYIIYMIHIISITNATSFLFVLSWISSKTYYSNYIVKLVNDSGLKLC